MKSVNSALSLGSDYSKKELAIILNEPNIATSREGIYYCKNQWADLLFVDLEKQGKETRFHFNDYFEKDIFHWDSQTTQHLKSPKIVEIMSEQVEVLLFVRVNSKISGATQPFVYCGRLVFLEYTRGTTKPIHLVYQAIEYDGGTTNPSLRSIYDWADHRKGKQAKTILTASQIKNARQKRSLSKPSETVRSSLQKSRMGQEWFRNELLSKWDSSCAVTGLAVASILVASHIKPWSDCSNEERLDAENGILLSPSIDALFDRHLVSFDDSGGILISSVLRDEDLILLGITRQLRLRHVTKEMRKYLIHHRNRFVQK